MAVHQEQPFGRGPRRDNLHCTSKRWFRLLRRRFQAAVLDNDVSESDIWRQIGAHAALGARVLRVFAFSNGDGDGATPTPWPLQAQVRASLCARPAAGKGRNPVCRPVYQ